MARTKKNIPMENNITLDEVTAPQVEAPAKPRRGRPKKVKEDTVVPEVSEVTTPVQVDTPKVRKGGRPPKNKVVETTHEVVNTPKVVPNKEKVVSETIPENEREVDVYEGDDLNDLVEIAKAFGGQDALDDLEGYCAPIEGGWSTKVRRVYRLKGKDVTEVINVIITRETARMAVDNFYTSQKYRISVENQVRSVKQGYDERGDVELNILEMQLQDAITTESNSKLILETIAANVPVCRWMTANVGIGPILAVTLYAYFDPNKANYASGFISYAGLNNNNRPRISKEQAAVIIDEIIGSADGDKITDEMLMDLSARTKWPLDYLKRKAIKVSKVTAMCTKKKLIDCVTMMTDGDNVSPTEVKDFINELVEGKSATMDDLRATASKFDIDYETLFRVAVSKTTQKKLSEDGGTRSREELQKAITVLPYNKDLKMTVWKMSQSFVYQSNREGCLYGQLYKQRMAYELVKNEAGDYADQCANILKAKSFKKSTEAYKAYSEGKLPKAHITARAMRWAAKVFITHLFEAMWVYEHQSMDHPQYYAIDQMGHHDVIHPVVSYKMLLNENLPENQRNLNPVPVIHRDNK